MVSYDTPSCSTRGAVTGHVTSNATDYRMHPLAFAELTVPTATPNTSNAMSIFIVNSLSEMFSQENSKLFGSVAEPLKMRGE